MYACSALSDRGTMYEVNEEDVDCESLSRITCLSLPIARSIFLFHIRTLEGIGFLGGFYLEV